MTPDHDNPRLTELRAALRKIDDQIIDLVAERFKIVKGIGDVKKHAGLAIQDEDQELKNLAASLMRAAQKIPKGLVEELTTLLAAWSRKHQE